MLTCVLCLAIASPAAPIVLVPGSGWQDFLWYDPGFIDEPADGFSLTSTLPVEIRITDLYMAGDAFQVYVDNVLKLTTPIVAEGPFSADPDAAWNDPAFSQGSFFLGPGTYLITIDTYQALIGGGAAAIRADAVSTPEPSTWLLLGTALVALGAVRRRLR